MEIKDIAREKALTEIIAERDAMILTLVQEKQRLNKELDKRRAAETKEDADK